VAGRFDQLAVGDEATVRVPLPHGPAMSIPATVVDRHGTGADAGLGLSLRLSPAARGAWVGWLVDPDGRIRGATAPTRRRHDRPAVQLAPRRPARRRARLVELGAVAVVSAVLLGAVSLTVTGYRLMVIRSGSMVPTMQVGDVVVVDWVEARNLRVGDVVTFPGRVLGEPTVTHRIRNMTPTASGWRVETRGDANESSEVWAAGRRELLGKVVARVPAVGGLIARIGRLRAVLLGAALALGLLAAIVARSVRVPRRDASL
jgi:signal peptidase I